MRKVHIRDLEGKLLYNRLYDDGSVMRFESGFGGVDHLNVQRNRWQVCEGWHQPSDQYEYVGNLSATPPDRAVSLWCDDCRVKWTGCQDAAECPRCGSTEAYEASTNGMDHAGRSFVGTVTNCR